MKNVFIFDHPLIQHKISLLRDKNTEQKSSGNWFLNCHAYGL